MIQPLKRLRIEPLETRTLLSASFGGGHFAPEPVHAYIGVEETGHRFEHRVDHRVEADVRVATPADAVPQHLGYGFPPPVWRPPFFGGRQTSIILVIGFHPIGNPVGGTVDVVETSTGQVQEPVSRPPLMATAPPPNDSPQVEISTGSQESISEPLRFTSAPRFDGPRITATLPSLYSSTDATTITTRSVSTVFARAHDVAIQDYTSRQLLLSTGVETSDDDDLADDLEDVQGRKSKDDEADEFAVIADAQLRDDVADSLGKLQRERAAIEQVLAELHEVGPIAGGRDTDAAHSRAQAASSEAAPTTAATDERATADPTSSEPVVPVSHGGMVLLAASGDANDSAYDLTAVTLSGTDNPTAQPIGTEAAVGVYQAFDVGTAELRSAKVNDEPRGNPVAVGEAAPAGGEAG